VGPLGISRPIGTSTYCPDGSGESVAQFFCFVEEKLKRFRVLFKFFDKGFAFHFFDEKFHSSGMRKRIGSDAEK
jgi:hypothetical protein